jgi:inosose dehydratase
MGAYVETADDVDHLMRVTRPEVGLLHDTGHVTFAGGDAPTELAKHVSRVVHVHCKDVRPAVAKMARNRGWSFLQAVTNEKEVKVALDMAAKETTELLQSRGYYK